MPLGSASQQACMYSPRAITSFNVSSSGIAPAKQSAEYSPSESPAAATTSGSLPPSSALSASSAASEQTTIAGWLTSVRRSSSSGPSKLICLRSKGTAASARS